MRVRLLTAAGEVVTTGSVPPFSEPPAVLVWGSRVFQRHPAADLAAPPQTPEDATAPETLAYREVFAVALAQSDAGAVGLADDATIARRESAQERRDAKWERHLDAHHEEIALFRAHREAMIDHARRQSEALDVLAAALADLAAVAAGRALVEARRPAGATERADSYEHARRVMRRFGSGVVYPPRSPPS